MKFEFSLPSAPVEDKEDSLSDVERIELAIKAAVESALGSYVPKPLKEVVEDPDWSDAESVRLYIKALHDDLDYADRRTSKAKATYNETYDLHHKVQELVKAAVETINLRQAEVFAESTKAQNRKLDDVAKINKAQEVLAELLAGESQIEALAQLKQELETLCEGFSAWGKARPYQTDSILQAVQAYQNGLTGFLDADDMGLGKTFKSAVMIFILTHLFRQQYKRDPKILWVTKKSLITANLREIKKWYGELMIVPNLGKTPEQRETFFNIATATNSMMICSYENVRDTPIIKNTPWDMVFADEVHRLKGGANPNGPTLIWQVMRDVCRKARFMYFLSGTPIVNRGEEMWSYLHIFAPGKFPQVKTFKYHFLDPTYDLDGNVTFKVNVPKLMNALQGQMIHRTKAEVAKDLPDKMRHFEYLIMEDDQKDLYASMRDNMFVSLDKAGEHKVSASVIIAHLNRLRQIAVFPKSLKTQDMDGNVIYADCKHSIKTERALELVEEINDQVVIFSAQFNAPIEWLAKELRDQGKRVATITGQGYDSSRLEQDFQNGKIDVLIINMQTGSEGLNLHKTPEEWVGGASHAIFLDLWWNPARNEQAEDRLYRIGVKEPVSIHILQCEDSVDAFVAGKIEEKAAMIMGIMDRKELRPASEWRELLEGLV